MADIALVIDPATQRPDWATTGVDLQTDDGLMTALILTFGIDRRTRLRGQYLGDIRTTGRDAHHRGSGNVDQFTVDEEGAAGTGRHPELIAQSQFGDHTGQPGTTGHDSQV